MTSRVPGVLFSVMVLAACAGDPQAPSPVARPAQPEAPPAAPPAAPAPPDPGPLAGEYDLAISLGSACAALPEAERSRTYAAVVASGAEGGYVVSLTGGVFLSGPICTMTAGLGCHEFLASASGNDVRFELINEGDWHGGHIVERTSSGWIELTGEATGVVRGSRIEASGTGRVWYCPEASSYPFPCRTFTSCSAPLRMTLTRR